MVSKDFTVSKRDFNKKKYTVFQHKLRVVMKCYTILELEFEEGERRFTFKKSHKLHGIRMDDPRLYTGTYDILPAESERNITLRINI